MNDQLPGPLLASVSYLQRWRGLGLPARLYLIHAALLTTSLAIVGLLFNLAVLALGFSLDFLGLLNTVSFVAAALLSVPLLWLVTHMSLRLALLVSAMLQCASVLLLALVPSAPGLLVAGALGGAAAVLFQVSAPPFMMRHSDDTTRDHLFSANAAILIGLAGMGSLVAGQLPGLAARLLGVGAESALAYRAAFAVAGVGLGFALLPLLLLPKEGNRESGRQGDRLASEAISLIEKQSPIQNLTSKIPPAWRELARHPIPLLKLLLSPALISIGAALLIPYLNLFFKQRFAVADDLLGIIFAALGLVTALAALAGPALSARLGKIHAIVLTQALALPFLALMGSAPMLGVVVGAALVRAALFNLGTPLYDAFAMERTDESARPAVIGLINGASSIGYAFAPIVSTRIQAAYGFTPLFVVTLVCYALAVLAKYWFFARAPVEQPSSNSV
ncbi:MAG TPA: MFS transporter [Roseiflexaceae bacterium]|nr:MFS transporter [Roseiflexaceae bacterium]